MTLAIKSLLSATVSIGILLSNVNAWAAGTAGQPSSSGSAGSSAPPTCASCPAATDASDPYVDAILACARQQCGDAMLKNYCDFLRVYLPVVMFCLAMCQKQFDSQAREAFAKTAAAMTTCNSLTAPGPSSQSAGASSPSNTTTNPAD